MTTGHVFIATSLDGFIARPDGDIDWLLAADPADEEHGYAEFIAGVDGIVMGRGSYEKARSFPQWPYPLPVVVLSRKLDGAAVPAEIAATTRFWNCAPREAMRRLAAEGWARAYVDGGKVIQSFLRDGLIAEMIVTRVPILLGEGLPLFGPTGRDIALRHLSSRAFPSGLAQSHYAVVG